MVSETRRRTASFRDHFFLTFSVRLRHFVLGKGKRTGLITYSSKGGTSINEAWHRVLDLTMAGVHRLGPELADQRLLQSIHRFDVGRDRKLGRTSKQSTLYVWRERDANDAARGCLLAEPFPKAGPRPDVRINSTYIRSTASTCNARLLPLVATRSLSL